MKRMKVLFGQRRMMVLVTLAVLVLTAAVVIGSGASFTASSANPDNLFTAGSLSITNSKDVDNVHHLVISANGMKPGDHPSGAVTIGNGGSLSGTFTLNSTTTGDAAFAHYLQLVVLEDGNQIYSGPLDGMTTAIPLTDGTAWSSGATHVYTITVTFPNAGPGAENGYMSDSATLNLDWAAVAN
jgi:hypothetical protein